MKRFMAYLKDHRKVGALLLISFFLFFLIIYLTGYPLADLCYATLLCLFIGCIFLFYGYYKYRNKIILLERLNQSIYVSLKDLPAPETSVEQAYQKLLSTMFQYEKDQALLNEQAKTDLMNYYTLWVHQVKTPIAALHLLLQSDPKEQSLAMENELFKIEQYTEMVLSYLRLGSNMTDYKIASYSLDAMIRQALRKYARLFIAKKLTLHYESTDVFVLTDEKWMLFIIEQLLSNALKYTKSGSITISVTKDRQLSISDTGIGIDKEDVPRVFEKGFTGYNGRTDKKSTGLGLYLVKLVVDQLGHRIFLTSEPNKGTKVTLDLNHKEMIHE